MPHGKCGDKTVTAIGDFQRHVVKMFNLDGRVDPGGNTIQHLIHAVDKVSAKRSDDITDELHFLVYK